MIRITHLNTSYGDQVLFDDVSVSIGDQEKIGLVGRNGSGKSTFLRMLLDRKDDQDGALQIPSTLVISALEQHLDFDQPTVLQQVAVSLPKDALGQEWKAESILMGLGFTSADMSRAPGEFSSGYQIRIRLAQALVAEPHLLLLDEPTNYLDILSLRWLERFLKKWKGAFILVTHDRHFMDEVVTHTIGIHRGKMRKMRGGPKKLMEQIATEEEVYEKTRQNQVKKQKKTEEFINSFRAGARSAGLVQSRIKALEKQDIGEKLAKIPEITFHFKALPFRGDMLLKAHNLSFAYEEHTPIIHDFSLATQPGDKIAIIGRNGKGKSTLLKLLAGRLQSPTGKRRTHPELQTAFFGADSVEELQKNRTILEELRTLSSTKEQEIRGLAGSLLFTGNAAKKKISVLSGGERSRVSLGKTMLFPSHLLFLDEPTNHLDMESSQALIKALKEYSGTLIFVSHDEDMISELANRLVVFDAGQISLREQSYQEFLGEGGWSEEENESLFLFKKKDSDNKKKYLEEKERKKRLRWVQNRQQKLNDEVDQLTKEQHEVASELEQAYANKNAAQMKQLGSKLKEINETIEQHYQEMEELMEEEIELTNSD